MDALKEWRRPRLNDHHPAIGSKYASRFGEYLFEIFGEVHECFETGSKILERKKRDFLKQADTDAKSAWEKTKKELRSGVIITHGSAGGEGS